MATDWVKTTIGNQITLQRGFDITKKEQRFGKVPVISSSGISSYHDTPMVNEPGVVIGRKGTLGTVFFLQENYWPHDTTLWVKDFHGNDPKFVYYFLRFMSDDFYALDVGSANPTLNRNHVHPITVDWPRNLAEQRSIARILGTLDDKIELNRRMNHTLESLARAIFQSWFVDFDPVTAKAAGRKPVGISEEVARQFPDSFEESSLGLIPKGWRVVLFPEDVEYLEGPGLRNWQYKDIGMKFLNIRCIGDGDLDVAKANCIDHTEFMNRYSHFALQEDDIVISTSGTLGRMAIVRNDHLPVMLNTSIIRMRSKGAFGLTYVWGLLHSDAFQEEMLASATGSVQLNFGPMHLRAIKILRPSDEVLAHFESLAQPFLRKVLANRKQSTTLAALRNSLLPQLLSGELRIKDAEKMVEKS